MIGCTAAFLALLIALATPATTLGNEGSWLEWAPAGAQPTPRSRHSTIHDPVRNRMVVFGGDAVAALNDVLVLTLDGAPVWNVLTPDGTPPIARSSHSAIYDPVRDRMVVFGGDDGHARNDVWSLSLGGTPRWTALAPTGTPASERMWHTAIYDPVRDRMVVFGGAGTGAGSDVWAMSLSDPPTWTELTPSGFPAPGSRRGHTAIYDPVRDRMVMFGGFDGVNYRNDVWALSLGAGATWTPLDPSGVPPISRWGHSAIYDSRRDRMVVFGGVLSILQNSVRLNDSWGLSLASSPHWDELVPSGMPPSVRFAHSAIHDSVQDRMLVFGGFSSAGGRYRDVWGLTWDTPVPAMISLVSVEAKPDRVTLTWIAPAGTVASAIVERRTPDDDWRRMGSVIRDGIDRLSYEDRDVTAGNRYGYRLAYTTDDGETTTAEVWVDVSGDPLFALNGAYPNPTANALVVEFSLPNAGQATLEVYDPAGRLALAREVGPLGGGVHRVDLSKGAHLPTGVYSIRLVQGQRSAAKRAVVIR